MRVIVVYVEPSNIIAHDDEDVGLLILSTIIYCHVQKFNVYRDMFCVSLIHLKYFLPITSFF